MNIQDELTAALASARSYQAGLTPAAFPASAASAAEHDAPRWSDGLAEGLARLTAPEVSRLIAREIRERKLPG